MRYDNNDREETKRDKLDRALEFFKYNVNWPAVILASICILGIPGYVYYRSKNPDWAAARDQIKVFKVEVNYIDGSRDTLNIVTSYTEPYIDTDYGNGVLVGDRHKRYATYVKSIKFLNTTKKRK